MILSISQYLQKARRGSGFQVGLAQLAEAIACAADRGSDPWQFAVSIEVLLGLGVSESELRWLVSKGYAQHAREITTARDTTRRFQPGRSLAFAKTTCLVLTDAGARYAATVLGELRTGPCFGEKTPSVQRRSVEDTDQSPSVGLCGPLRPTDRPHWDGDLRVLRVGTCMVKKYMLPSPNQETILAAFQEEGWPRHIDDPLSPKGDQDPKCRLHDTIKRLNRHQRMRLLHFSGDGTGTGVCWEMVAAVTLPLPSSTQRMRARRAA
jgi:hypothetical protein